MNLAELKEAYKARKLALDSAKKEEEKYKVLLKDAMLEAGELPQEVLADALKVTEVVMLKLTAPKKAKAKK